ncbi:MAG TPA: Ig-like domain-containing protein, partial [Actinomycetota bacterium]|nr:Ig-like domain-containing protein [Actinomycetota bacterium]
MGDKTSRRLPASSGTSKRHALTRKAITPVMAALFAMAFLGAAARPAYAAPVSSTTTVTATPNPVKHGESVTFTATVTPSTATGTVQFKIDGASVASGVLSGGTATVAMSHSPEVGTHTVTAEYAGDANVAASTGTVAGGLKVNPAKEATTATVTVAPNPVVWGDGVAFEASVTPASATGTVQFRIDGQSIGTATLGGGKAALAVSHSPQAGNHTVSVHYGGDGTHSPSSGSVAGGLTVLKRETSVELTSSRNPAQQGEKVVFTAQIGPPTAGGTVQFTVDGHSAGAPVGLSEGAAGIEISNLSAGHHSVGAAYSGDQNLRPSSGTLAGGQKILAAPAAKKDSTTELQLGKSISAAGAKAYFVAKVSPAGATGTVQFKVDGANFGSPVTLSGGSARSGDLPALPAGRHTVSAEYSGDSEHKPSSASAPYDIAAQRTVTTTALRLEKTADGKSIAVATVKPENATGTVQFSIDGTNVGGPVQLQAGVARSLPMDLSKGSPTVRALYSGDQNHQGSGAAVHLDRFKPEPSPKPTKSPDKAGGVLPRTGS